MIAITDRVWANSGKLLPILPKLIAKRPPRVAFLLAQVTQKPNYQQI